MFVQYYSSVILIFFCVNFIFNFETNLFSAHGKKDLLSTWDPSRYALWTYNCILIYMLFTEIYILVLIWRHEIWCHEIWGHEIWRHEIWRHEIWGHEIWRHDIMTLCINTLRSPISFCLGVQGTRSWLIMISYSSRRQIGGF